MVLRILRIYWKKGWFSFFICASYFLYLLNFTWLKWGNLIVDTGREAHVPLELISGKLLYRDIFYLYGPFSPYFNAFLFKIFGSSVNSLILSGIITSILCGILIYKISRFFLGVFTSTLVVITFLFVFAFEDYSSAGIFNFILPYTYSAIHGILFSLAVLYFFYMWLKKKSRIYGYACSLFLALALLCKIEIGLAILFAFIIGLSTYLFKNKTPFDKKDIIVYLSIFIAAPIFLVFSIYSAVFILSGNILAKTSLLDTFFNSISFNSVSARNLFGADDVLKNILVIAKVFLYYTFLCTFFILGGFIIKGVHKCGRIFIMWMASFYIAVIFLLITYFFVNSSFAFILQYKTLPLMCFIMAVFFLRRFIKNKGENIGDIFIVTLSIFSFLLMFKMFLNAWALGYGFYALVPGLVVYYIFFLKVLPNFLKIGSVRNFYIGCFIFLCVLFIINHFDVSKIFYQQKILKISTDRGDIYTFSTIRELRCKELVEFLIKNTDEKETVVVFPEGVFINFLSKRENPLYYYHYIPMDLVRQSVENDIINDIKNKEVDYIVIIQRATYEFGYIAFGYDYGKRIFNYIMNNYTLHKQFGPFPFTHSDDYGIAIFKRKDI